MTTTQTHTPGPWFVNGPWHIQAHGQQGDARPRIIAQVVNKHEPDARHIVHCVNTHDALVEALAHIESVACGYPYPADDPMHGAIELARQVLAKAKGGS